MQSYLQYRRLHALTRSRCRTTQYEDTDAEKSTSGQEYTAHPVRNVNGQDQSTQPCAHKSTWPGGSISSSTQAPSSEGMQDVTRRPDQQQSAVDAKQQDTNEDQDDGQRFIIDWEEHDDCGNPRNWSYNRRLGATVLVLLLRFVVTFASSIDSSSRRAAADEFGVATVVESMATAMFLFGLASGAVIVGPLSETYGRSPVYIVSMLIYMPWLLGSALAPNIGSQLVFRYLAGCFAAAPLVCSGGSLSDLWDAKERTITFTMFATVSYIGPLTGPIIGGWIVQDPGLSWRWTEWVTLIVSGFVFCLILLLLPETFAPVLLGWKAKTIRGITGDERYKTDHEKTFHSQSWPATLQTVLVRPFTMVVQELVVLLFTIYLSILYIILYTFLGGYEKIFGQTYGLSPGLVGTCFAGMLVGISLVWAVVPVVWRIQDREINEGKHGQHSDNLRPEIRLYFSILGGAAAIPLSLFWMAWTAYPSISIASPLLASVLFGYGVLSVWMTAYQYIIDSYESYSASALAAMTTVRYLCAGSMVIVGVPFYNNLGIHYTLTILACLSSLMTPIPYLLYFYGGEIRARSKYATSLATR